VNPGLNILICGSDRLSRIVDWEDRATCVLFGDGASAFVVNGDESVTHEIIHISAGSDGTLSHLITMPYGGTAVPLTPDNINERKHYMRMDGKTVFKFAIKTMVESCKKVLSENNMTIDDISWLVPHQANQRIMDGVGKKLEVDPAKVYSNVERYGNVSAASIPLAICEMADVLKEGDILLLTAFGSGLTWASGLVKW
jgi:3-oxoacyl-[acyl-carrier-protein] synthase-3